jgi:outer membrane immunogenic protein
MNRALLAAALILIAYGLGNASAADLGTRAAPVYKAPPPVATLYSWTGFYVGGDVGALWTHSGAGVWDPGPNPNSFGEFPITGALQNDGSFVGGVHVGYNWQFAPTWVAGIEGDWSWTDAKSSFTAPWVNTVVGLRPSASSSLSLREDWLSTVRARMGYLLTPAALVYFTGGAAWGELDYAAKAQNEPFNANPYIARSAFSKTAPGYVLGGGFEYAFWGNWSARAEYLYYHLSTTGAATAFDSTGTFPPPSFPSGFVWTGGTNINSFRAGVSYKFF